MFRTNLRRKKNVQRNFFFVVKFLFSHFFATGKNAAIRRIAYRETSASLHYGESIVGLPEILRASQHYCI